MMNIVEYTELLVKSIAKDADLVKVSSYETEEGLTIDIMVPESSMGSVMGKNGRNIKSIRTLVYAYGYLHKSKKIEINVDAF